MFVAASGRLTDAPLLRCWPTHPWVLTCPPRFAGTPWAARGLDIAVAPVETERRWTEVFQMDLASLSGEARGAGAGEAGGRWRSRARGAWGHGKQGLAAAPILAELGITAGVRELASLTQKSRGTPGVEGHFRPAVPLPALPPLLPPLESSLLFSLLVLFPALPPPPLRSHSHEPHSLAGSLSLR